MSQPSVVVIGGGLSGLAAALSLSRSGAAVTVLEKSAAVGGRARSHTAGGFVFNLGPHALYDGPARAFLRELGVPLSGRRAPGGHLVREGRRHTLPTGPLSLLTTGMVGLGGRLEAARFLNGLPQLDPAAFASLTVRRWLEQQVRHSDVREMLEAFVRLATYSNAPQRQSAEAALSQFRLGSQGVIYLDGGWQSLVDGLLARVREAGVDLRARAAVAGVEAHPALRVRLADGTSLPAEAVLVAADPATASRLLPRSEVLSRAAARAVPVRAACLDLALRRLPRPDTTFALGVDRPLYFSVHSASARLAPEGGALVHAAMYLPDGPPAAPEEVERELEVFVRDLQPGFESEVVVRRFLPELVVAGALVTAEEGGFRGRPDVAVAEAPGVFVAGDWVGPEGLLADASLASARRAADAIAAALRGRRAA
jgi:phytoene dehydrogenase-like protein